MQGRAHTPDFTVQCHLNRAVPPARPRLHDEALEAAQRNLGIFTQAAPSGPEGAVSLAPEKLQGNETGPCLKVSTVALPINAGKFSLFKQDTGNCVYAEEKADAQIQGCQGKRVAGELQRPGQGTRYAMRLVTAGVISALWSRRHKKDTCHCLPLLSVVNTQKQQLARESLVKELSGWMGYSPLKQARQNCSLGRPVASTKPSRLR